MAPATMTSPCAMQMQTTSGLRAARPSALKVHQPMLYA